MGEGLPTKQADSFHRMTNYRVKPNNIERFISEEANPKDDHVEPLPSQNRPKHYGGGVDKNLTGEGRSPSDCLSLSLSVELRHTLLNLLKEFKKVFVWTYAHMRGLVPQLVKRKLNVKEETRTIKQASRNIRLELEVLNQIRNTEALECQFQQAHPTPDLARQYSLNEEEEQTNLLLYRLRRP